MMIEMAIQTALDTPIPLGRVLADSGNGSLPPWVNYGVLGLLVLAIAMKQFVPGWLYTDIKAENLELRAENRRLVDMNLETQAATAPALASATKAIEDVMVELRVRRGGG